MLEPYRLWTIPRKCVRNVCLSAAVKAQWGKTLKVRPGTFVRQPTVGEQWSNWLIFCKPRCFNIYAVICWCEFFAEFGIWPKSGMQTLDGFAAFAFDVTWFSKKILRYQEKRWMAVNNFIIYKKTCLGAAIPCLFWRASGSMQICRSRKMQQQNDEFTNRE